MRAITLHYRVIGTASGESAFLLSRGLFRSGFGSVRFALIENGLQHHSAGPDGHGALAELGDEDLAMGMLPGMFFQFKLERRHEKFARCHERSGENDQFRIEEIDEVCQTDAEIGSHAFEGTPCGLIAVSCGRGDVGERGDAIFQQVGQGWGLFFRHAMEIFNDRGSGTIGFDAASIAAAAEWPVAIKRDVAKLAGKLLAAPEDFALEQDAHADAFADIDAERILGAAGLSEPAFRHGQAIGVVFNIDSGTQTILK